MGEIRIGDIFRGELFGGVDVGTFEVMFVTKQSSTTVRVKNTETGIVRLVNVNDDQHDLVKE